MNPFLQLAGQMYLPQVIGGGLVSQGIQNAMFGNSGGHMLTQGFKDAASQPMAKLNNQVNSGSMNDLNTNLNKMAEKITMEKISSADLKFVDDLIANMPKRNGMTKTAAPSTHTGGLLRSMLESPAMRNAMPIVNALALGTIGLSAGSAIYDKVKDAVKQNLAYKAMFEEFPELNDMPSTQVDKYWGVLNDFAPKLTTNPLVAGQFISNMASYGMRGIDHNVVGQLAKIQGDLRNSTGLTNSLGVLSNVATKGYEEAFSAMADVNPTAVATAAAGGPAF